MYQATTTFPKHENYGLTSQLRRASASIPANIAEGCGRNSEAELARFMEISMGSASETVYFILLAHDLGYLSDEQFSNLASQTDEIQRMLRAYITRLRAKS